MKAKKVLFAGTSLLIVLALMICTASCGTIIYPERRGQTSGRIDAGVAVMDGVGLLIFLVPGVVAFAVDFATGAIYLPSRSSRLDLSPTDFQDARVLQNEPTSLHRLEIEALVAQQTGEKIKLASPETRVARMSSNSELVWGSISEVLTPDQLAAFDDNCPDAFN